jgi:hypothetical protein
LNDNLHSAHCRACKQRVREMLSRLYGDCQVNYPLSWPSGTEAYSNQLIGSVLKRIYEALAEYRGHREFIKSAVVPPCDYYVADPPFILEFDESQHFSRARLIAFNNYPKDLPLGFPLAHWQELCRVIEAKDDEPVDRDERRAWYDTLRDLVPLTHGFNPTVRIYAEELAWCSLDANARGLQAFASLLANRLPKKIHK